MYFDNPSMNCFIRFIFCIRFLVACWFCICLIVSQTSLSVVILLNSAFSSSVNLCLNSEMAVRNPFDADGIDGDGEGSWLPSDALKLLRVFRGISNHPILAREYCQLSLSTCKHAL